MQEFSPWPRALRKVRSVRVELGRPRMAQAAGHLARRHFLRPDVPRGGASTRARNEKADPEVGFRSLQVVDLQR